METSGCCSGNREFGTIPGTRLVAGIIIANIALTVILTMMVIDLWKFRTAGERFTHAEGMELAAQDKKIKIELDALKQRVWALEKGQ